MGNCDVDMKNFLVISEAEAAMLVEQTNKEQEKMEAVIQLQKFSTFFFFP